MRALVEGDSAGSDGAALCYGGGARGGEVLGEEVFGGWCHGGLVVVVNKIVLRL